MKLIPICACVALWHATVSSQALDHAQCIIPAKAGGGFDVSCQIAQAALKDAGRLKSPMTSVIMPGGIGALAFAAAVTKRPDDPHTITAFSGGSLLNLAQGKFGPFDESDVRWVAAVGFDYGVIAVRRDSPFMTLPDLLNAIKVNAHGVVFGAGGTIGSQDWMKAALLAKAAGVSFKAMRFVAFEGGGDALAAMAGGHIQVLAGDTAEVGAQIDLGASLRVLAVLSEKRLPGRWASVPTAREQGYDIAWPIVRGFYVGPRVSDAAYREWVEAFTNAMSLGSYASVRQRFGLQPPSLVGIDLTNYIRQNMVYNRQLVTDFGLARRR